MTPCVSYHSESSTTSPYDRMVSSELIDGILKAGSLISMMENKKINNTALLALLLKETKYQKFFTEITSSSSFREAVMSLLCLNPNLVKSKITKSFIKNINGKSKTPNRSRKTDF
jgi:hypothetical protein